MGYGTIHFQPAVVSVYTVACMLGLYLAERLLSLGLDRFHPRFRDFDTLKRRRYLVQLLEPSALFVSFVLLLASLLPLLYFNDALGSADRVRLIRLGYLALNFVSSSLLYKIMYKDNMRLSSFVHYVVIMLTVMFGLVPFYEMIYLQELPAERRLPIPSPISATTYSSLMFLGFFLLFAVEKALSTVLTKYSGDYRDSDREKQKNMVVYYMELIFTTAVLVAMTTGSVPMVFLEAGTYPIDFLKLAYYSASFVATLYVYEIIYKDRIRFSLLSHHLASIFLVMNGLTLFVERDYNYDILRSGALLSMQALTEQPTFLGLIMYRFNHRWTAGTLKFAAILSVVLKNLCIVGAGYYWVKANDLVYWIVFPVIVLVMFLSQMYANYVVWSLGVRFERKQLKRREEIAQENPKNCAIQALSAPAALELETIELSDSPASSIGFDEALDREPDVGASRARAPLYRRSTNDLLKKLPI